MTVLDRKKLRDGAQGRSLTVNKINSLWTFLKYTYHPTYHKRIPDCFFGCKDASEQQYTPPWDRTPMFMCMYLGRYKKG